MHLKLIFFYCFYRTITASNEFAKNPCSSEKRGILVNFARNLLSSVSRIMMIADILDSRKSSRIKTDMEANLAYMQEATTQEDLFKYFKNYGEYFKELMNFTSKIVQVNIR